MSESDSPAARAASPSNHPSPSAIDDAEVKDLMDEDSSQIGTPKKGRAANGVKSDDDMIDDDEEDAGGLFGSGSEDEVPTKKRTLDDEDLDSGDDIERRDRIEEDGDADNYEQRVVLTASVGIGRHAIPKPSDGEIYLLRNANFMGIEPKGFTPQSFTTPTIAHHNRPPASNFSPAQVASHTMRWRRSPDDPSKVQSNTRLIRWSDGSLTLQIASNAISQLELPGKPLAPAQRKPVIPTPVSQKATNLPYDARQDSHTYLASTHMGVGFVQLTNHITTSLSVQASTDDTDDALIRLQENMAAAMRGAKGQAAPGPSPITVTEDPELAKKKAEIAEREKSRAEKRRQSQLERARDRTTGVGRAGARAAYGSGLTAGALEDGDARPKKGARKTRRRGSEYSDDEGDYRRKTKEDEYDEDDGFLVGSDEEPEVVEDDDEEEEEELDADGEDDDEGQAKSKSKGKGGRERKGSPKRAREEDDDDVGGGRGRRRRVLDEEDEDE